MCSSVNTLKLGIPGDPFGNRSDMRGIRRFVCMLGNRNKGLSSTWVCLVCVCVCVHALGAKNRIERPPDFAQTGQVGRGCWSKFLTVAPATEWVAAHTMANRVENHGIPSRFFPGPR